MLAPSGQPTRLVLTRSATSTIDLFYLNYSIYKIAEATNAEQGLIVVGLNIPDKNCKNFLKDSLELVSSAEYLSSSNGTLDFTISNVARTDIIISARSAGHQSKNRALPVSREGQW